MSNVQTYTTQTSNTHTDGQVEVKPNEARAGRITKYMIWVLAISVVAAVILVPLASFFAVI